MEDWIKLHVDDKIFVTKRKTLCAEPESMLAKLFDPESKFASPTEQDGAVLLDEDPETFKYVMRYLRGGCDPDVGIPPEHLKPLLKRANYFGLEGLAEFCEGELQKLEEEKFKDNDPNKRVDTGTMEELKIRFGWQIERVISEGKNEAGDCAIISRTILSSHEDEKEYQLVKLEKADEFVKYGPYEWQLEHVVRGASWTDKVIFSKALKK